MDNKWLEPAVEEYKKYFGDTAKTIFDIGTRDGDDAEYFRQKLNGEDIYVFDANPIAVSETKRRYPNFKVFETAIGSFRGQTKFTQIVSDNPDEAGCSSVNAIHRFPNTQFNDIIVSINRLDLFIEEHELSKTIIDIVKIDVEGFSWDVLMGMGDVLQNIKMLHIETENFNRHPGHKNNEHIFNYMNNNNFICVEKSYEWGPTIEDQVWINQKFV